MKRNLVWMPVAIVTFLLGIIAALFVPDSNSGGPSHCTVSIKPITVKQVDCKSFRQFPGRSVAIAKLPQGPGGYFPRGTYAYGWKGREAFMNEWYGKHLKVMLEPSLLMESRPDRDVYRFLWLRTFHNPMSVRIERNGSTIKLFLKELSGAGGYDPGELIVSKAIALDQGQWCLFTSMLEQGNYWNEPLEEKDDAVDGAQWILEGVSEGRYHAVDRWSPDDGDFREACIYLLELAGVETAKLGNELY